MPLGIPSRLPTAKPWGTREPYRSSHVPVHAHEQARRSGPTLASRSCQSGAILARAVEGTRRTDTSSTADPSERSCLWFTKLRYTVYHPVIDSTTVLPGDRIEWGR